MSCRELFTVECIDYLKTKSYVSEEIIDEELKK